MKLNPFRPSRRRWCCVPLRPVLKKSKTNFCSILPVLFPQNLCYFSKNETKWIYIAKNVKHFQFFPRKLIVLQNQKHYWNTNKTFVFFSTLPDTAGPWSPVIIRHISKNFPAYSGSRFWNHNKDKTPPMPILSSNIFEIGIPAYCSSWPRSSDTNFCVKRFNLNFLQNFGFSRIFQISFNFESYDTWWHKRGRFSDEAEFPGPVVVHRHRRRWYFILD